MEHHYSVSKPLSKYMYKRWKHNKWIYKFIILIDKVLKNHPLPRHNLQLQTRNCLRTCHGQELWTAKCVCTAKTQYKKFETNIPRKGTARPQSQFLHSCVFERSKYSHDQSTFFSWSRIGRPIVGIYKLTVRPQSQFLHSCFCKRFIYFYNRSGNSAAVK